jgi:hypothetical protein
MVAQGGWRGVVGTKERSAHLSSEKWVFQVIIKSQKLTSHIRREGGSFARFLFFCRAFGFCRVEMVENLV